FNPFADATKGDDRLPAGTEDYIHIRIQQRNGRKTLTTVQGIADDYDKKKLVKAFKKKFACNGTVIEHPEYGEVIQLQGDQRKNICQFLTDVSGFSCFSFALGLRLNSGLSETAVGLNLGLKLAMSLVLLALSLPLNRLNWPKRSSSRSTVSRSVADPPPP
uniref:Eukaryotic translation initiation factor 1 n=1 Tax=Pygocentrus nattereri TaxID=42514 RepID=A0AAR2KHN9_PYGNA